MADHEDAVHKAITDLLVVMHPITEIDPDVYLSRFSDGPSISVTKDCIDFIRMSPRAARAVGARLLQLAYEAESFKP